MVNRFTKEMPYMNNPFIALKHKNFRYFWIGMCVSLVGTWMQNIAQPWLAYSLTQSPLLLSLIGALQYTPAMLLSLFAGVVIDRFPKKKLIVITQSASLVTTLILATLVWSGSIRYWHIAVIATIMGIINTLDMPARQAFVAELVGKEDLMNAVALNATVFNLARVIGPAIAGLVMGYAGIATCFFANAISFGAVLVGLFFVKAIEIPREKNPNEQILKNIKEGLMYIYRTPILFNTVLTTAIVSTFAMNFSVLVPVFSKVVLKQGETGFGFLMSFMGIGAFLGAMSIASSSKTGPKKFHQNVTPIFVGVFLILTAFGNYYIFTAFMLSITGFFFVAFNSTNNSAIQLNSPNEYRGRIMSVYNLVFIGSTPLGNLYAGYFADRFGPNVGFIACGIAIIILMSLLFAYRRMISIATVNNI